MYKIYVTSMIFFLTLLTINAQERKFQINFGADTGFSKVEYNDHSISASTSGATLHLQYGISKFFSLESGLDYFNTQGNISSFGESYFMKNQYLSVPLGIRTKIGIGKDGEAISDQRFTVLIGGGLYTNYLMKTEMETIDTHSSIGWNLGGYGNFGIHIQANRIFSLGAGLKYQKDFSDIEKNNVISVKQNRNVIYLDFGVQL